MNKMNLKYGLVAIAGLGLSANVSATELTCSDITFTPDAYASYEFIDQACLEVVDRDGGTFAKTTARIVAQTSSGTHFRFRHADGELGPSHKSKLPRAFRTMINDSLLLSLISQSVRTLIFILVKISGHGLLLL